MISRHDANKILWVGSAGHGSARLPQWRGVLRIVGRGVVVSQELQALRRALPRPEGLELIQELNPAALLAMLRSSLALVSASMEEGFDYPVLEAKAEGIPTVLSQIPVHVEFHAGSSLFFPSEGGEDAFAAALARLLADSRLWWISVHRSGLALSLSVTHQQRAEM